MIFVPFGYTHPGMTNMNEIKGGSAWGPGTLAGGDGSRQPSPLEKEMAQHYGQRFAAITNALKAGNLK